MNILAIIFIISAFLNIILLINKWIKNGGSEFCAIAGWVCSILYCSLTF